MIIQYVRDKERNPIGTVVALSPKSIGASLCSPKDKWNRKIGIEIAKGRAKQYHLEELEDFLAKVPESKKLSLKATLDVVIERARKYYK
jgi:hypothetical protein